MYNDFLSKSFQQEVIPFDVSKKKKKIRISSCSTSNDLPVNATNMYYYMYYILYSIYAYICIHAIGEGLLFPCPKNPTLRYVERTKIYTRYRLPYHVLNLSVNARYAIVAKSSLPQSKHIRTI